MDNAGYAGTKGKMNRNWKKDWIDIKIRDKEQ